MKKKGQAGIIALSIGLIIGVILLTVIFTIITDQQAQTAVANDTFTAAATNQTCTQLTDNCYASGSLTVRNGSAEFTASTNFSECLNGNDRNGVQIITGVFGNQTLNASYTEESCSRIQGGLTILVINNYTILLAVALIVFMGAFLMLKR